MYPPHRWKAAACLIALLVALQTLRSGEAAGAPDHCPDLYVVAIPGTWETSPDDPRKGMLATSLDGLPGDVRADYVAYAATAFPWEGAVYGRSKQEATDAARGLVAAVARACSTSRIALLGYSQGADAAGDLAAEIGTGLGVVAAQRVVLVGLIADPRRSPTDTLIGPPVPGAGAGGPRPGGFGLLATRTYTFCAAGDLYCSMADDDFAGRLAGLAAELSAPDPAETGRYRDQASELFGDAMAAGGLGMLSERLGGPGYERRRQQFDEFLKSGVHQSYPFYPVGPGGDTALTWLRRRLTELVNG